jgi:hypothetical protein
MHIFSHAVLLFGFVACARSLVTLPRDIIAPNRGDVPEHVKIKGVSVLGTGCPAGTADVQVDATGTLFEVTFSAYEVETGPGTMPSDWRKNCKLTINMEFTSGFQFVLSLSGGYK